MSHVAVLQSWAEGITTGKIFASKYRDFAKATKKVSTLQGLSPYIGDFIDSLTAQGIVVDNNLLLLRLTVFYPTPSSDPWSQRFRKMASYGSENA